MPVRHFLSLMDMSPQELRHIIARASAVKQETRTGKTGKLLDKQTAALLFEQPSTRTRVSFETGVARLGGHPIFLTTNDLQMARGESIADTARVLSRMVRIIIMRSTTHARIEQMAKHASVPVINALSDFTHPCQQLADLQTYCEQRGELTGTRVAWVGDGNNVCHSWMNAAYQFDFHLAIATPPDYQPNRELLRRCAAHVSLSDTPRVAVKGAAVVATDIWAGLGQEQERAVREAAFQGFCVDEELLSGAAPDALFMHCLPAHRGEEVSAAVIDGAQSVVWEQAENRVHAQTALMEFLLEQAE